MALEAAQAADTLATQAKLTDLQLVTQVAVGWVLVLIGDQYTAVQIGKTLYNNLKEGRGAFAACLHAGAAGAHCPRVGPF
jgi:hypothetical protein